VNESIGVVRAVYERWRSVVVDEEGAPGADCEGATEAALAAFAGRHGVTLPASFRELYRLSNGTSGMDGHEQIFWPIDAM
jgi:hypothetical protein